ncbi:MAG TPA: phosphoribosyltransferase family protein [Rhizomicrobium sp.]|nr:phosphoribosyltransferase family protein [Rhizomicrobium sp.]
MLFRDRDDAGLRLAAALAAFKGRACVVLALPRGGVPVAAHVADILDAPLDLLLVRKIGAPQHEELAVGAVIDGGAPIVIRDEAMIRVTGTTPQQFDAICARELAEIERRRRFYLAGRPAPDLKGKIVIVVDDGLATGNTMRAALKAVRRRDPAMVVMAIPVAPAGVADDFRGDADLVVCLATPEPFGAVGYFYGDFGEVSDAQVIALLSRSRKPAAAPA